MLDRIAPYYKAVTGLAIPFLTTLGAALMESSDGGGAITAHEWITASVVALIAGGAVFAVPNKDPQALHQDESVQPPEPPAPGYVGTSNLHDPPPGVVDYDPKHDAPERPDGYTSGV